MNKYQEALHDNLLRVKNAKKAMDSFGDIGASTMLNHARHIYKQLEELEEQIQSEIIKEDHSA